MRLIDADELVKYLKQYHGMSQGVISDVEHFPTAHMAIEALEKQVPKTPNYEGDGYSDGVLVHDTWICPCCGKKYEVDCDDYKYCPECGQAIDWSEEE